LQAHHFTIILESCRSKDGVSALISTLLQSSFYASMHLPQFCYGPVSRDIDGDYSNPDKGQLQFCFHVYQSFPF